MRSSTASHAAITSNTRRTSTCGGNISTGRSTATQREGAIEIAAANRGGESGKRASLDNRNYHGNGAADSERRTQLHADCTEYAGV